MAVVPISGIFFMSNIYAYTFKNDELGRKAKKAYQEFFGKGKKKKSKPATKKAERPSLKQKRLKWFITSIGHKVEPSYMENEIRTILNGHDIAFYTEVSFEGLNPTKTKNGYLRFDFYIPSLKMAIEYNGREFHKDKDVQSRDRLKRAFCRANGIELKVLHAGNFGTFEKEFLLLMKART